MASIQYVVNATDAASAVFAKIGLSADNLDRQLEDLSKRVADPEVNLEDSKFTLGIIRAAERLDKLSAKVADPKIEVDGAKAQVEILRINAMLDRLDAKRVTAKVNVDVDRHGLMSRLGGLFGGGGGRGLLGGLFGAAGGAASAGGGAAGNAPPQLQAVGIAAAITGALALGPALLPTLLGGGVGLGAAGGAFTLGQQAHEQMQKLQKSLASARGAQRKAIEGQIRALRQASGPELAIFSAFQGVGHTALGTFTSALEARGAGGAPSFLTGLTGILKQLGGFIKTIGPGLGGLFRASLPFLRAFVITLERAAKILLPVFTQSLRQMQPFLPMISQGLLAIVQGLAGMIKAMGPGGMKAAAQIFVALAKGMEGALIAVGYTANFMAETFRDVGLKIRQRVSDWHRTFDDFRHRTAVVFDGVRHDIAHVWDQAFENTIGTVIRFAHNVETQFNSLRHGIAGAFNEMRRDVAAAFDGIRHGIASIGHDIAAAFDAVRRVFAGIGHSIADVFDRIRRFQGQFDAFGKDIQLVRHWITDAFDGIRHGGAITFDFLRHLVAATWDAIRHGTAAALDAIRHSVASAWDAIRHGTAAALDAIRHSVADAFNAVRHGIAAVFDSIRHGIAAAWDAIFRNSNSQTRSGLNSIVGWFRELPGRVIGALFGLGHRLYAFGHAALSEFWNGLRSVAGSIFSWVGNFVRTIWDKVKKFFGISSPSSLFYDIGKNLMLGLFHGIKDNAHHAAAAAASAAHRVSAAGSGVQRWAGMVREALRMEGLSQALAGNVLFQMSTESGGNPNAINLTDINARMGDPSRGLMQVIGSTFAAYHWPGTSGNIYDPLANIAAALNYARHVYGPTLMSGGMGIGSGHGYESGSWNVPYTGPATVHQGEMIIPAAAAAAIRSGGGGNTYNITVSVPPAANKADIGRVTVEAIREFEKRSGTGWRR